MSIPRATMSVATRTSILSALELEHHIIALSLLRSLCMAPQFTPICWREAASCFTFIFAAAEDDDTLQVASLEDVLDDGHLLGFIAYVCLLLDLLGWLADGKL